MAIKNNLQEESWKKVYTQVLLFNFCIFPTFFKEYSFLYLKKDGL